MRNHQVGIDLTEIGEILTVSGVPNEVADSGSGISCIFIGKTTDDPFDGTPRYHVVAGPGWMSRQDGLPYGTAGEFSFGQDTAADHPEYAVREWERPSKIAGRIAELYRRVEARRRARMELTDQLDQLPAVLPPIVGEDLGDSEDTDTRPTATKVLPMPEQEAYQAVKGRFNLICGGGYWRQTFEQQVAELLDGATDIEAVDGAIVYCTGEPEEAISYSGSIVGVREGSIRFADAMTVKLADVIAVKI